MDETAFFKEIAKYLWGVLVPAGWWIFNKQDKRIDNVEATMYTKNAAKDRREEVDKILEDRRQDVIALHSKIDFRSEKLDDKLDRTQILLAKIAGKLGVDE